MKRLIMDAMFTASKPLVLVSIRLLKTSVPRHVLLYMLVGISTVMELATAVIHPLSPVDVAFSIILHAALLSLVPKFRERGDEDIMLPVSDPRDSLWKGVVEMGIIWAVLGWIQTTFVLGHLLATGILQWYFLNVLLLSLACFVAALPRPPRRKKQRALVPALGGTS